MTYFFTKGGHEYHIPDRMMEGLKRWIDHGIKPGSFMLAVLTNDLRGAIERADDENLANLPAYLGYLYNEAPGGCWGSVEKVADWAKKKAQPAIRVINHTVSNPEVTDTTGFHHL